ncbi:MAG: CorA family divalent cation transporter [Patescibacteria group bacterium]
MIQKYHYQDATWIDLENPTKADVEKIAQECDIDLKTASDIILPANSPRAEFHGHYAHIILHFPIFKRSQVVSSIQEIDFILSENTLITARFDHIEALHKFAKIIETEAIVDKKRVVSPAGYIFFRMVRELYSTLFDELKYIDSWSREIETKMFRGQEHEMVFAISNMSRVLLDLERTLSQHEDVLSALKDYGPKILGSYFEYHIRSVIEEYGKLRNIIKNQRDIMAELRETNNSLLSSKQNEVAKIVTVLAFIAVPISLVLNVFQIESRARPIIGSTYDFWILIGIVLLAGVFLFTFFKYKKWL